jgi:hypothetical protein
MSAPDPELIPLSNPARILPTSRPVGDRLETVSGLGAGCVQNKPVGEG